MSLDPQLVSRLDAVKASFPSPKWSWDDRFSAVAATFPSTAQDAALASAKNALPNSWTNETLAQAPKPLQDVCNQSGGLRAGQLLLGGPDATVFGLWWPWGGGATITLRVGLVGAGATAEHIKQLRAAFAVG